MTPFSCIHPQQLAELSELAERTPAGCFVEVGVYQGGSAWHLAQVAERQSRQLHLFDTFAGMPFADAEDNHPAGDFADTSAAQVSALLPNAHVHVGVFPDTLPDLTGIAFAHVDCDQYRSTKDAISHLLPRMVPGGVMVFDDYGCTRGATRAVDEAFPVIEKTSMGRAVVRAA